MRGQTQALRFTLRSLPQKTGVVRGHLRGRESVSERCLCDEKSRSLYDSRKNGVLETCTTSERDLTKRETI